MPAMKSLQGMEENYFDSKSWYKGTIDPADFSESMLSEIEKNNIELIKKYE